MFILCSFSFSSLGHHPRFCVNLIVCSFGFLSLGDYRWFYLNLFFLHLVSHHWGTILGSILVYSLFFFFIIRTPSYVLSQFLLCYFCFSSLRQHHRFDLSLFFVSFKFSSFGHYLGFYLSSIVGSFSFSLSLGCEPRFNLTVVFVALVSHPLETILRSISIYSLFNCFLIIGTPF